MQCLREASVNRNEDITSIGWPDVRYSEALRHASCVPGEPLAGESRGADLGPLAKSWGSGCRTARSSQQKLQGQMSLVPEKAGFK